MAKSEKYRGRPSALSEDTKNDLLFAIRRGLTLARACDYAGISYGTLRNWLNRAAEEEERLELNPRSKLRQKEADYVQFARDYEEALADSEVTLADVIKLAADGGHTATEKTSRITKKLKPNPVTGQKELTVTEEVTIEKVTVSLPDWRAALAMLERRRPEAWGRRQLLEHVGDPDRPVGAAVVNPYAGLSEEDINDRLQQLMGTIAQERSDRPYAIDGSEGNDGRATAQGLPTGSQEEEDN